MNGASAIKSAGGSGDEWGTPFDLWSEIREKFFPICEIFDPCPNRSRILPGTYATKLESDGLKMDWGKFAFVNPPFSDIGPWIKKASAAPTESVLIVPVRSDQPWWHENVNRGAIVFIRGRVNYVSPIAGKTAGASFPSCLILFGDRWKHDLWWPKCHQNRRKKK